MVVGKAFSRKINTASNQDLQVLDWGVLEYGEAMRRQTSLVEERIADSRPDCLVLVEHPAVVTIGRSGSSKDLHISEDALRNKGWGIYHVDRGGMTTCHGPGQLVAYPIINLKRKDLHLYVQMLLHTLVKVLENYGLDAQLKEGKPGIWVNSAKIASIGIAVKKWVTYHGLALNVSADPALFRSIVPCGNPVEKITSLAVERGSSPGMSEVKNNLVRNFCSVFEYIQESCIHKVERKHPPWLVRPTYNDAAVGFMQKKLRRLQLETVCENACCPNIGECFERGTATFMILGAHCTRNCRFCAVDHKPPLEVDPGEPARVARAADLLDLKHVVVTSVTRDDLTDGGSEQFVRAINEVRKNNGSRKIEVLVPDFKGSLTALRIICNAHPDVFNHNIETVARLYPRIRPQAFYRRSLAVLAYAARQGLLVKSGMMLGLGETDREVMDTLKDIRRTGCSVVTIGQYLAPSKDHASVERYISPPEFAEWADFARGLGFKAVSAGPLVRSSYQAGEMLELLDCGQTTDIG